jgi:DNA-binding XRE family transcriptional regulator
MKKNKIDKVKTKTLSQIEDKYIGKRGSAEREKYEYELRMEILGKMIRAARKEPRLSQEELGNLIGVQKAQISKLERSTNSATVDTILKVYGALNAEISFRVKLENRFLQV